jgi:molybdopterin-guanine dinucleotide biosynthesis protein A
MSASLPLERGHVALGILAGGQARRLGGADKALARHRGQTLAQGTLAALGDGFAHVLISYNGASAALLPAGARVVADLRAGFPGPLGGVEALLNATHADWLLTVPVDLADIPEHLVDRLLAACIGDNGVAVHDAEGEQPLVALWPVESSRAPVSAALNAGERGVHRVQQILNFGVCELSPLCLGNLNTPADFDPAP